MSINPVSCFLCLVSCFAIVTEALVEEYKWRLKKAKDGIEVYTAKSNDNAFTESELQPSYKES